MDVPTRSVKKSTSKSNIPPSIPPQSPLPAELFTNLEFLEQISFLGGFEINTQNLYANTGVSGDALNFGDSTNEYTLNSLGYRSREFKKVPLLFAGCSVTFGVGVPLEGIWSTIVGEKLGLDYTNLSTPGWSTQRIVDSLFRYFYEFGNPEVLFVVFPDYHRLVLTSNREFCVVEPHHKNDSPLKVQNAQLNMTPVIHRDKYSKKPHNLKDFITPEYALAEYFRSINALISYCKGSNIKLVWSTWDAETHEIIDIVKDRWNSDSYSNYVYSKFSFNGEKNQPIDNKYSGCHSSYVAKYQDNFFRGQDFGVGDRTSHPGIHYHMHLAEEMLKGLENLK